MQRRSGITILVAVLVGAFLVLAIQTLNNSPDDDIGSTVNEATEEIRDEIDDNI